jgi:23S rRNA G2069 N7-methylase RlmK/C1962 C5-methylase RlmI
MSHSSPAAEMLANRLRKRLRVLRPWAARHGVSCWRLYDHDIPDVPLTIDWYDGAAVVSDRRRFDDELADAGWLPAMRAAIASALGIEDDAIHVRARRQQKDRQAGGQYQRVADAGAWRTVREGGHTFWVNLSDYLDTGLFLDHRPTRARVGAEAGGRRVLNLFCYTGSFTVYAARGGASASTSVDLSRTYLDWAGRNWDANGLDGDRHVRQQADIREFLAAARARGQRWDLAVVDPPTFSNSKSMNYTWDVQRDHAALLRDVAAVMAPAGVIWFSTNRARFTFDPSGLPAGHTVADLTRETIPEDFRDTHAHRAYRVVVP